jgi:Tol biopolymer transport system component
MHPDGTGSQLIHKFESMNAGPIWSPDSKTLLLASFPDDFSGKFDVFLLDVATRKLTKEFRNAPLVFGWVRTNQP